MCDSLKFANRKGRMRVEKPHSLDRLNVPYLIEVEQPIPQLGHPQRHPAPRRGMPHLRFNLGAQMRVATLRYHQANTDMDSEPGRPRHSSTQTLAVEAS